MASPESPASYYNRIFRTCQINFVCSWTIKNNLTYYNCFCYYIFKCILIERKKHECNGYL